MSCALFTLERAIAGGRFINLPHGFCWNQLDRDRARLDRRIFVPQQVHMVAAAIYEAHPLRVDVRRAAWVIPLVTRDRPEKFTGVAMTQSFMISGAGQQLLRQIGLRLLKLRPLRVRAVAERYELRVQRPGFVSIA